MSKDLKLRFFIATIESILLYGCESWTLTEALEKSLYGTYTRMLRKAQNSHWSSHTVTLPMRFCMANFQRSLTKSPPEECSSLDIASDTLSSAHSH